MNIEEPIYKNYDKLWKLMRRVHCQSINQISMKMYKAIYQKEIKPNQINSMIMYIMQHTAFQYNIYNKSDERVFVNPASITYRRLKNYVNIWYGQNLPQVGNKTLSLIQHIHNQSELQEFVANLDIEYDKQVQFRLLGSQEKLNLLKTIFESKKLKFIIYDLQDIQKLYQVHIKNKNQHQFPSFSQISVKDNSKLNKNRFVIFSFFSGINIQKASQNFLALLKYYITKQQKDISEYSVILKFYERIKIQQIFSQKHIVSFYTDQPGIYKILNMCLRALSDPRDIANIRLPYLQLCLAIMKQSKINLKQPLKLYRTCQMKKIQIERLSQLKDRYIQMDGFLSTSKKKEAVYKFKKFNNIIDDVKDISVQITVQSFSKNNNFLQTFSDIQYLSKNQAEQEVLFNSLNTFKVIGVIQNDTLQLLYIDVQSFVKNRSQLKQTEIVTNFFNNCNYQRQMFTLNRTQGEVFWRLRKNDIAKQYYIEMFKMLVGLQIKEKNLAPYNFSCQYESNELYQYYIKLDSEIELRLNKDNLIQVMKSLIFNNNHLCIEFFFYAAKSLQNKHQYQNSLIFLKISLKILKQISPHAINLKWIVLSNIGINNMLLDMVTEAKKIYKACFQFMKSNNIKISIVNYTFLVIPIAFYYEFGMKKELEQLSEYSINLIKQIQKTKQQLSPWIKLIASFSKNRSQLISALYQFKNHFKKILGNSPFFIVRLLGNLIQKIQLQIQSANSEMEQQYKIKQFLNAAECFVSFDLGNMQMNYITKIIQYLKMYRQSNNLEQNFSKQVQQFIQNIQTNLHFIQSSYHIKINLIGFNLLLKLKPIFHDPYKIFIPFFCSLLRSILKNRNIKQMKYMLLQVFIVACELFLSFRMIKKARYYFLKVLRNARKIKTIMVLDREWIISKMQLGLFQHEIC